MLFKLVLNLVATLVLIAYTQIDLEPFVRAAAKTTWTARDMALLREPTNVAHSVAALALLVGAVVLAVYKPRGLTRYGWQQRQRQELHSHP